MRFLATLMIVLSLGAGQALAALTPDEMLDDPTLEARARAISLELRCLVCQNQSIDDSDAPLARDLRLLVRERLVAGDGDDEIMDFVVARYGEFVLLRPTLGGHTLILWATPALLIGLGVVAIVAAARRRRNEAAVAALSAQEERDLADILDKPS